MDIQQNHSEMVSGAGFATGTVQDYIQLLKPRVMSLVVFTGFVGFYVAPGASDVHPFLAAVAIFCIALAAGASGAINMWYDRDIDAVMKRTKARPIPQNKIVPDDALAFGVVLTLFSIMMMGLALNWVAAALLLSASLFYVFVYTIWLKRRTPQNIVIGGAAGAFPPMIGWAAATGNVTVESVVLFSLIFFWTPPHFWALALFRNEDYTRAKVPMLPVVAGSRTTKRQMMFYTVLLACLSTMPYVLDFANELYLAASALLNAGFILAAWRVLKSEEDDFKPAKQMFGYSILYLFALFAALMFGGV